MSLNVLGFTQEAPQGKRCVTVESDKDGSPGQEYNLAITELQGPASRNMAIKFAAENGIINARCELPTAPYAVDPAGNPVVKPTQQRIYRYRTDIPISQGLGQM